MLCLLNFYLVLWFFFLSFNLQKYYNYFKLAKLRSFVEGVFFFLIIFYVFSINSLLRLFFMYISWDHRLFTSLSKHVLNIHFSADRSEAGVVETTFLLEAGCEMRGGDEKFDNLGVRSSTYRTRPAAHWSYVGLPDWNDCRHRNRLVVVVVERTECWFVHWCLW